MPVDTREALPALTALLGGALAAFVLTAPPGGRWSVSASDRELDRYLGAQPTGVAIGVVLAVAVYLLLQHRGSRRLAWATMAVGTAVLVGGRFAVVEVAGLDGLTALHYVKTAAAGAILGAAVAAAWGRRVGQLTLTLGVTAVFLAAPAFGSAAVSYSTSVIGEPSWWLLAAAGATAVACAVLGNEGSRVQRAGAHELRVALTSAVAVAVANRLLLAWIGQQSVDASRYTAWVAMAASVTVVLVTTEVCARMADGPDGRFLLGATAIAAAATPVLADLRMPRLGTADVGVAPWVAVAVAAASVAVGLRVSMRWRLPLAGLALAAVVPLLAALWPDLGDSGAPLLVRLALVGAGAGLALGATAPGAAALAATGLGIPFVSTVFYAVATVPTTRTVFSGSYQPLTGVETGRAPEISALLDSELLSVPHHDDRIAGVVLLIAVAFCAFGIRSLGRPRTAPAPGTPDGGDSPGGPD
ncbi:hypothetical protein [Rhodococcus kronopolitis]|uniref:Uncharacterized protein n=1 Tax=Rhodococcus kronopolitis TaxID=1460226 RepID=A0ABV9FRZ9_9NOCA